MINMNIETLINNVTTQTVIKLKKSGLMKENQKPAYKKTEEVLKNYGKFKIAINNDPDNTYKTIKFVKIIDNALKSIEDDPYYEIVPMFYFENKTREQIAEFYDVEPKTISRNKKRLVNTLKVILFSDNTIEELFL